MKAKTKFKPILFSYEMAKANRLGNKTQTRRTHNLNKFNENPDSWFITNADNDTFVLTDRNFSVEVKSKYSPGDVLWIKETFAEIDVWPFTVYRADYERTEKKREINVKKWKPSIFMPMDRCRQWVEIISVSLERLASITESESISEGIIQDPDYRGYAHYNDGKIVYNHYDCAIDSFKSLWCSINGPGSFVKNPWVFCYKYKVIEQPKEWSDYLNKIAKRAKVKKH